MEKDFLSWSELKEKLDKNTKICPYFKEGEIWWCSVGLNIGSEIFGKGDLFLRPVLIMRKLSRFSFFGVPLTSKVKKGSWYVNLSGLKSTSCANLAQLRVFDAKRILYRREQIGLENFILIKVSLKKLMLL